MPTHRVQASGVRAETYIRKDAGFENSGPTEGRARGGLVPRSRAGAAGSLTPGKPGYR
jgi:hypothetical protein